MKRTTQFDELRALDQAALARKITELERTRDRARLDAQFGSVKNHQALSVIRRQLAQAKTIQHAHRLINPEKTPSTLLSPAAMAGPTSPSTTSSGSSDSGRSLKEIK